MPEGKIWDTIEQQKKIIEHAKVNEKKLRALLLQCRIFMNGANLDDCSAEILDEIRKIPMIEEYE